MRFCTFSQVGKRGHVPSRVLPMENHSTFAFSKEGRPRPGILIFIHCSLPNIRAEGALYFLETSSSSSTFALGSFDINELSSPCPHSPTAMRNLSDILNPVPRSETPEQNVDPHSHRTDYPKGHTRFASLSSPLHALALAAEEHGSPPMNSPTSPHFTGASFPRVEHRRDSTSSSGPGANQHVHPHSPLSSASNPARPENMPPPRFDQHQHQNLQGVARRLSDIADGHAIHLPPLRRSSGEDREFAGAGHSIESYSIFPHHPTSRPAEQESKDDCEVNMTDPSEVNRDATVPSPVTSPPPIENHRSPEPQQEPHVKSEFTGVTPTMTNFPSPTPTRGMSSPRLGTQTSRTNSFKDKPTESQLTPPPTQAVGALLYPSQQSAHETDPKKSFATAKMEKKVEKKGTASIVKKPARRKADTKSKDGTPLSQRSITPVSSRASKTPAPGVGRKQASATPLHSSPPPSSAGAGHEGDDDDGSTELFCICRKPDDHTWMIACDGPCEDWFHGRCVNMDEEKGKLIDKYFCMYEKNPTLCLPLSAEFCDSSSPR